eukprot:CAMPEP_0181242078 /NCGR_PEP_ID=MMETSP1096-20121128/41482_1 /TAXON_ID=156174 ORGANISM="Chrysochromulina ericina, Strain CCMP281" /NCGR_SAMPLE_ID=MMETSP1096 /ASSEMBLY_ACC=CAM_ASM_000453 /LENGTH=52 /DNA_ID=CAMNT_0023338231 /DNA_START=360 /DNA_END=514 /DNA_ORIENTATION=-
MSSRLSAVRETPRFSTCDSNRRPTKWAKDGCVGSSGGCGCGGGSGGGGGGGG